MEKVGHRIRILREMQGLSQENMAQELGISQQGYSVLERRGASIKLHQLMKISEILGVSIESILSSRPFLWEKESWVTDPKVSALEKEVELLREKVMLLNVIQAPPPFNVTQYSVC